MNSNVSLLVVDEENINNASVLDTADTGKNTVGEKRKLPDDAHLLAKLVKLMKLMKLVKLVM